MILDEFNQDEQNRVTSYSEANCIYMSDLNYRLVISVGIKVEGYKIYILDTQIDTGAMISYAKRDVILRYYWKPITLNFRAINGNIIPIQGYAPNSPFLINGLINPVMLYCYDLGCDMLFGQYFSNTHFTNYKRMKVDGVLVTLRYKNHY